MLFYQYRIQSQISEERVMADNNRNWSLIFAQFSWLVLGANWDTISVSLCQAFGAVQHLTWLCVFMWTGNLIYLKQKTFVQIIFIVNSMKKIFSS